MNGWRSRLSAALVFWLVQQVHAFATQSLPNTPEGMHVFHGSAALADALLMLGVTRHLYGQLADDMEALCFASIIVNFIGWILYMAYAPPVIYNTLAYGVVYVQYLRLTWVDRNDAYRLGVRLVRRAHHGRAKSHT